MLYGEMKRGTYDDDDDFIVEACCNQRQALIILVFFVIPSFQRFNFLFHFDLFNKFWFLFFLFKFLPEFGFARVAVRGVFA
jgi:hypothetical protein